MKVLVALGGNALIGKGGTPTISNQFKTTQRAMKSIVGLIKKGHKVIITFGNGVQVGLLMLCHERGKGKKTPYPLGVAVAESQGQIGHIIEQSLLNELAKNKLSMPVANVLTHVLVSKKDKEFKFPSKPVGPFYSKTQAVALKKKGIKLIEDSNRGYRKVVASPKPLKVLEAKTISSLFNKGVIVIACGGGGIPVVKEKGKLKGVSAVIDKDLTSALLVKTVKAQAMLILTSIEFVCLNFGKKNEEKILKMSIKQTKHFLKKGHFLKGSMEPKVRAAISFLEGGGKKVVIASVHKAQEAMEGKTGTLIVP